MRNMIPNRKEKGFTLIELVMVIVILGILAAFALPRFADLGGEAEKAAIEGARGAVKSASGIVHSKWLAQGSTGSVDLEGATITMVNGYPTADTEADTTNGTPGTKGIAEAAQIVDDFTLTYTSADSELKIENDGCSFTYINDGTSVPEVSAVTCP